ncbi:MAG: fibronectin type III domain-containing protein, partial [Thermoplasmata archaeon]|nr:fibronectin type III domain-containing protein [Thermoplasmata archaeon]
HISYCDVYSDLRYARWTGSAWNIETVDSLGIVGDHSSLALDSHDLPHIGYYDGTNDDLRYAKWNGSAWSIETVDSVGRVGRFASLAMSSGDFAHISYLSADSGLKYARWNGTAWNFETVGTYETVDDSTSMALDSNDYPHIGYQNWSRNLKYATKARLNVVSVLPPANLTLCVLNGDDILLSWTAPSSPLLDPYLIYRSTDQRDFDFSNPEHNTSSDPDPLKTDWMDIGATNSTPPREYYYVVRAVNSLGSRSATSNTAGKWTKEFFPGLSSFSLPLEPSQNRNVSWYSENIPGTEFVRWMNATGYWVTFYPTMGEGVNDIPAIMGDSYEISLSSPINFTFCGNPASMIRFQEGLGDSLVFRRSLSAQVEGNDINLSWEAVTGAVGYQVFRSEERNALHNLSLLPIANTTETYWVDSGVIGNERSEYYYMVIPADPSGGLGSSTYSIGVFTEEYQSGADTFALPLKPVKPHSLDWYCDNIPNVVGIIHLMKGYWRLHAREMPEGVYDAEALQAEGHQISIGGATTTYTFVGY